MYNIIATLNRNNLPLYSLRRRVVRFREEYELQVLRQIVEY